jgi:hypothetical protein
LVEQSHVLLAPFVRDSPPSDRREYSRFSTVLTSRSAAAAKHSRASGKGKLRNCQAETAIGSVLRRALSGAGRNCYLI